MLQHVLHIKNLLAFFLSRNLSVPTDSITFLPSVRGVNTVSLSRPNQLAGYTSLKNSGARARMLWSSVIRETSGL
jgi:hypothetical protein